MFKGRNIQGGFALPTVLIASVVMLAILATSVAAVTATRTALQNQFYSQLAKDAAESGLAMAKACMKAGTPTWANPLRPGGTCAGLASQCTSASCYLVNHERVRTTFTAATPAVSGDASTIQVTGTVELVRASTGAPWRTFTQILSRQDVTPSRAVAWKQVSSGAGHACAIASDNGVYCWGANGNGQLGNGGTLASSTPVAVSQGAIPAGVTIQQVSTGNGFSCALGSNGKAYCWGSNSANKLGDGTVTQRNTPVAVSQGAIPAGVSLQKISSLYEHTCATASDNKAYCWGDNSEAQLGNGGANATVPVAVVQGAMPAGATIQQIVAGFAHTCVLASDNAAYCWGDGGSGQLGRGSTVYSATPVAVSRGAMPVGSTIRDLTIGRNYTCAIASDNKAYCWGFNSNGQLGDSTATQRTSPVAVSQGALPTGAFVRQITGGYYHTCAIASDNKAYCWGLNTNGRLGDNSTTQRTSPVAVSQGALPTGALVRDVSSGESLTCAIASNNGAYCWGSNSNGQLGDGSATQRITPVAISPVLDTSAGAVMNVDISAGSNFSCGIASNKKIYCWGQNNTGQIARGAVSSNQAIPIEAQLGAMPIGSTSRQVSAGSTYACAIASDNKAYCWGFNGNGRLGDDTLTQRTTPVAVSQGALPSGATIRQLDTGGSHTCAVASDNKAYCWGDGANGKLGNGSTSSQSTPVEVALGQMPAGTTILQVSATTNHTCAVASNNKAYCWGNGTNGKLGNGSSSSQSTPVEVALGQMPAGTTIRQISTGLSHNCVVASNNKAYCWGAGSNGQLGNNSATTTQTTPVEVVLGEMPAGTTIKQISAGYYHTCVVASNSKAYCWGMGANGRLGVGTVVDRLIPGEVDGMPVGVTATQVSAKYYHTCALASDDKAYCWGMGANNGLGNGTTTDRTTAVPLNASNLLYPVVVPSTFYF